MQFGEPALAPSPAIPVRNRPENAWFPIYHDLRTRIVSLALPPGQALNEKRLATEHGVSRTPVREALLRLADEDLVRISPKSGTFVAPIPTDRLSDTMLIRKAIESLAVRLAARSPSGSAEPLHAALAGQRRAAASACAETFHAADEAFHAAVATLAGHPALWEHVLRIKTQVDRYRRLTLPMPNRMGAVIREHEAILDAVARGDERRAAQAMEAHLDAVLPALTAAAAAHPGYFAGR